MEPVLGQVQKWEHNPLFRAGTADTDGKDNGCGALYCTYPNVFRDPAGLYRCYYTELLEAEERGEKKLITALAYAQSADGFHWERPDLGITQYRGSRRNNLLLLHAHGSCVFYDEGERLESRRYKLITLEESKKRRMCAAFSEDGLHFGAYLQLDLGEEIIGDTHNFCFFDKRTGNYRLTTRAFSGGSRLVMSCTSKDFIRWSAAKQIFRGEFLNDQSYSMPVFFYAGLYFGLVSVYHGGDLEAPLYDKVECELICSPDCESFSRLTPHKAFIPLGKIYDDGCIYCSAPIEGPEEFVFYYTGANGLHSGFRQAGLQAAVLKKAYLAGMGPADKERAAWLRTQPFEAGKRRLYLTLRLEEGGSVQARLLEADGGTGAEGFGYEDFDGIRIGEGESEGEGEGESLLTWGKKEYPGPEGKYILELKIYRGVLHQVREAVKD